MGKGIAIAKGSMSRWDFHNTGHQLAFTRDKPLQFSYLFW